MAWRTVSKRPPSPDLIPVPVDCGRHMEELRVLVVVAKDTVPDLPMLAPVDGRLLDQCTYCEMDKIEFAQKTRRSQPLRARHDPRQG